MKNPNKVNPLEGLREIDISGDRVTGIEHNQVSVKCIPADVIDRLLAETGLPHGVKNVGPWTAEIYEVVADLKSTKALKKSPEMHWPQLKALLDEALKNEEWSALDDLATAWNTVVPMPCIEVIGGEEYVYGLNALMNDPLRVDPATYKYQDGDNYLNLEILKRKRRPVSWIVVESVRQLQRDLKRIPFRSEILDMVTFYRPDASMDEQQLSRQLKELGLAQWIPDKRKKSTTKCEVEQDLSEES